MSAFYNPIVRSFNRYRSVFCDTLGVPRQSVRPGTPLAELVPPPERARVWAELHARGLAAPELEVSTLNHKLWDAAASRRVGPVTAWLGRGLLGLFGLVPAWTAAREATRPDATVLSPFLTTVGELVMYGTRHDDHTSSGYTWSRGDLMLRVRMLVAEYYGLPLSAVRSESRFIEDLGA